MSAATSAGALAEGAGAASSVCVEAQAPNANAADASTLVRSR
ncbi:hypothetical protein CP97_00700 [Aurantiacibacter atlanticus]|uniref:Uncharacterized protein n=1 Tax=Aurantiacibacter atlanticus TaxID=1648404 RepID=A0A0H4VCR6_9SPHN|nr:hypothetical protein CP97_00700 [Aurantiacibacter atlanticus]